MVFFLRTNNPRYAAYALKLGMDFGCWHYPENSDMLLAERWHLCLITAKARMDEYALAEMERHLFQIVTQQEKFEDLPAHVKQALGHGLKRLRREAPALIQLIQQADPVLLESIERATEE